MRPSDDHELAEPVFYKATGADGSACHGGTGSWSPPTLNPDGSWTPGEWRAVQGRLVSTLNGFHLTTEGTLLDWLGPAIWEAEVHGRIARRDGFVIAREVRLVRGFPAWNARTARLFAVACALDVLHLAGEGVTPMLEWVLHVARRHADGQAESCELAVARTVAGCALITPTNERRPDAAREAVHAVWSTTNQEGWKAAADAATHAAWAVAWDAEPDSDYEALFDTELNRKWHAAWTAARRAASVPQTELLMRVLGKDEPADRPL